MLSKIWKWIRMTIASAIENARNKIAIAYQTVENMGGTLPVTQDLANLPTAIESATGSLIDGSITTVDTGVNSIRGGAFANCANLDTVILRSNTVVDLSDNSIFENTPIASRTGNIYVPDELLQGYEENNLNYTYLSLLDYGSNPLRNIAYGNEKFVIAGNGGSLIYSTNGIDWTTTTLGSAWFGISFVNGYFVAGNYDGKIAFSSNGVNWSYVNKNIGTSEVPSSWWNVDYGNNLYVVVGGKYICKSSSLTTTASNWTTSEISGINGMRGIAYGVNKFVVGGFRKILYSSDTTTWYESNITVASNWQEINYVNNMFIANGTNGIIATSTDGINWNSYDLGSMTWYNTTYANGYYVSVGGDYTIPMAYIAISTDAVNWTVKEIDIDATDLNGIIYGTDKFIAVGSKSGGGSAIGKIFYFNIGAYNFLPVSQLPT